MFKCSKLLLFFKKIQVNMVKNVKNYYIINDFEQFFTFFTMLTWIFLKNNKIFEHLNVLLRIFFVSGVFKILMLIFGLLAEKVLAPKQFWRNFFFFIFFHPFESINFQPAGFLAFKEKSGPLLQPYFNQEKYSF